jgi:hypothetical protein
MTVHRILGTFVSLGLLSRTCHPGSTPSSTSTITWSAWIAGALLTWRTRASTSSPGPRSTRENSRSRVTWFTFEAGAPAAPQSPARASAGPMPNACWRAPRHFELNNSHNERNKHYE